MVEEHKNTLSSFSLFFSLSSCVFHSMNTGFHQFSVGVKPVLDLHPPKHTHLPKHNHLQPTDGMLCGQCVWVHMHMYMRLDVCIWWMCVYCRSMAVTQQLGLRGRPTRALHTREPLTLTPAICGGENTHTSAHTHTHAACSICSLLWLCLGSMAAGYVYFYLLSRKMLTVRVPFHFSVHFHQP